MKLSKPIEAQGPGRAEGEGEENNVTTTAIKSRPIPFSAPMIRALLEGRKTQTRRIVKPQPLGFADTDQIAGWESGNTALRGTKGNYHLVKLHESANRMLSCQGIPRDVDYFCPYGKPGDRLWLRENFRLPKSLNAMNCTQVAERMLDLGYTAPWAPIRYESDGATINATERTNSPHSLWGGDWGRLRVARFMPRWASRITLEITDVRVEHVQEISEEDAEAEGIRRTEGGWWAGPRDNYMVPSAAYRELWDSINGAGSWSSNPWVWVITFKRVES